MSTHPSDDRLSLLAILTDVIRTGSGLDERASKALAAKAVGQVRQRLRGCSLYVAQSDPQDTVERDAAIRRDYDGTRASRERLQLRFGVSRTTFYRIIGGGESHATP